MLILQKFTNTTGLLKSLNLVGNKHKNGFMSSILPYLYYDKFLFSLVKGSLNYNSVQPNYNLVQPIHFSLLEFPGQSGSVHQDAFLLIGLFLLLLPFPGEARAVAPVSCNGEGIDPTGQELQGFPISERRMFFGIEYLKTFSVALGSAFGAVLLCLPVVLQGHI